MNSLALDLRLWRATYRLSQERAAGAAGISLSSWKRYEARQTEPNVATYEMLRELISRPPFGYRHPDDTWSLYNDPEEPF